MLYLSRADVEKINLPMSEIILALEFMFVEKGAGRVEMPPKPGIHPMPDAFIHAMPAYIPALKAAGIKWVSGFPQNMAKGLPYISGLLVLNDTETGVPMAVMDCTWITAMRTGAATAVAAKYLAKKDASSVAILACGIQGHSNLQALLECFPIREVRAFDVNPDAAERFADAYENVSLVSSPQDAVAGADIVVTSGPILKTPSPVVEFGWLQPGCFLSPVDFDSYLQPDVFARAHKLATDDHAQMKFYRQSGYFQSTPEPYADLGELASGKTPGRESDDEINVAVNLGLGLEDMATAIRIYERALKLGVGTELTL